METIIQPRWLSLRDAAQYAAVGKKRLVELALAGKVKGFQDPDSKRHDWIFDIFSLDAYREGQCDLSGARKKALDILAGVRI